MSLTSADTPSFTGSSILRESPPFHPSLHTGPGGADLSLSELYISDRSEDGSPLKPFSLLPQRDEDTKMHVSVGEDDVIAEVNKANEDDAATVEKGKRSLSEARTREERLQHDLFVLKKLNSSFSLYNDALKDARSSTENVALQLDRTDRLLGQYVHLLQHTEKNSRLIFDESWEGGVEDQDILERLRIEVAQKAEREREELERVARLEQERQENEEQERKAREERDARERDKKGSVPVRGARGVRTRGVMVGRGTSTVARGRIPSASTTVAKRDNPELSSRAATVSRGTRRS